MNTRFLLILISLVILTSCSFNTMFLEPTKIPPSTKRLTLSSEVDTTIVEFEKGTYQPTFLKNKKDTLDLGFNIESVVFESSNGNLLNGWMLKPKNNSPSMTLLHFHGNAGFLLSQYQAMTPLLQYGFQIFIFDYSGFGFSEGKATRNNVLVDGNSALDYLKNRADVKNTKLIIYGQSLGGHLSAVIAQQRQSEIDGLVIEGAFSSHKDIAAERAGIFGRLFVSEKYSARKSIQDFNKPLLVIHSNEDKTVPFGLGKKLFANANEPKEFYEIDKCHICGPRYYGESISRKIKTMLE